MRLEQLITDLKVQLINEALGDPEQSSFVAYIHKNRWECLVSLDKNDCITVICPDSGRQYQNIEKYIASQFNYDDIVDEAFEDEDNLDIYQRNGYDNETEYWNERI